MEMVSETTDLIEKPQYGKSCAHDCLHLPPPSKSFVNERPLTLSQVFINKNFRGTVRPKTPATPRIARLQSVYDLSATRPRSNSGALQRQSNRTTIRPLSAVCCSTTIREEYSPLRLIEKLVQGLSSELRSNILEIASMIASSEKTFKETAARQNIELIQLQLAHDAKNAELHTALHECEVHRRHAVGEKDRGNLTESKMDDKTNRNGNGVVTVSRLTRPNDVLIDVLHITQPQEGNTFNDKKKYNHRLNNVPEEDNLGEDNNETKEDKDRCSEDSLLSSAPIAPSISALSMSSKFSNRKNTTSFSSDELGDIPKLQIDPSMKDEKLRNSLLKMSRDKYRMAKKVEILGNEVEILKTKLDISELKCRHLQIDLAEVRGMDDTAPFALSFAGTSQPFMKPKDFGPVDQIFKMMIERRAYNPVESILQFRRIVELMSHMPGSLKVENVANHMCSNRMIQILDVDMICIFIADFSNPQRVRKYTIRSDRAEEFDLDFSPSILSQVMKAGTHVKFTDVKGTAFDTKVDGCLGIVVRNVLSVPLKDEGTGRILGVIHLLNKYEGKVGFTELDEIFAAVFAEMAASTLLGCRKLQHVSFRADVLTAILAAPPQLLYLLPDKDSRFFKEILPFEILRVLEDCSRTALRCFKVKAFLLSDSIKGLAPGQLLSCEDKGVVSSKAARGSESLQHSSVHSGLVGFVVGSKKWVAQASGDMDFRVNPDVDVDPLGMPCVTAPLLNLEGDVIACLQMVCGYGSPKINVAASRAEGLTFEQAAGQLVQCLSGPLQSVLDAMKEKSRGVEVEEGSQLAIVMRNLQVQDMHPTQEAPRHHIQPIEESDKVFKYIELRKSMGFLEIEKTVVDGFMTRLANVTEENEELQRTRSALKRDLIATQLLYHTEKNFGPQESVDEAAAAEAKEIAGRIRMKKSHSRRLSFS